MQLVSAPLKWPDEGSKPCETFEKEQTHICLRLYHHKWRENEMSLMKGEIIMTVKDVITARYIIEECLDVRFMLDTMRFGPKIDVQDMMILWEPILNTRDHTRSWAGNWRKRTEHAGDHDSKIKDLAMTDINITNDRSASNRSYNRDHP